MELAYPIDGPLRENFDEMTDKAGAFRPGWDAVMGYFKNVAEGDFARSREQAIRLIQQNGVSYNIYGDPKGLYRPWEMDLFPHVIPEAEWKPLEAGLLQRAHLLDLILKDVYGPMRCLKEGLIPPEIVHGFSGFLRPCHGLEVALDRRLHFYAADIGRSPDGVFWIIGDKTQAPTGAGYALENRIVLSRVLDDLFKSNHVHRVAGAFQAFKRTLEQLSPKKRDHPRIVVLTSGTSNNLYFEHSYLARYLGYTLVHGEDLAFRHNQIYLKTLTGLQPIDVILRFVPDSLTDPLELNRVSADGIAGLVHAVRSGNLSVANSLGSGFVENPAFMAFLPNLCQYFLGEPLKLNSVATWWCGQQKERDYVLANLKNLIIRPAEPEEGLTSIYPDRLSPEDLSALEAKIRHRPHLYVGQERIKLSTTPILSEGRLEPRSLCLRSFVMASADGFVTIPGGLARMATGADQLIISDQAGTRSKDVWVTSPQPIQPISLLSQSQGTDTIIRSGGDVASRIADNLFWLGRYTERAEGLCRLLKRLLLIQYELDSSSFESNDDYRTLLKTFFALAQAPTQRLEPPAKVADAISPEKPRIQALLEEGRVFQLLSSLYQLSHSARDRLSDEIWMIFNQINQMNILLQNSSPPPSVDSLLAHLDQLILSLAAFDGLTSESMSRGQGWRFLDKGRRLERALHVLMMLRHTVVEPVADETPLLDKLLEINLCRATYRRRYLSHLGIAPVLDLILFDERHPRSMGHQVLKLKSLISKLPEEKRNPLQSPEGKMMAKILERFRAADLKALSRVEGGRRKELESFLNEAEESLTLLFDSLNKSYLAHVQSSRFDRR